MSEPSADNARIDGLYELAFRRHQAGQLREAEELYRNILAADPRQLDCLHFLGMIALQEGRPKAAIDLIGQAIAANDRIAAYHGAIAEAYRAFGERGPAIEHYRRAAAIDPNYWAAHGMLADLLRDGGEPAAAIEHYRKAVAAKPDLRAAQHNLAALLLQQGNADEALDAVSRALALQDTSESRTLFVHCVTSATRLPGDPGFRRLMIRALSETWGRPVTLAGPAAALIRADPAIAAAIKDAEAVWPQRLSPGHFARYIGPLVSDELLLHALDSAPICDDGLERLLTGVRTLLLDAALNSATDIAPEMLPFACALARQCFINEYVFDLADAERDAVVGLRGRLASALSGTRPVFALPLIAFACFTPLHALDRAGEILGRTWPQPLNGVIKQQLREPDEEIRYRVTTPRLTEITDEVSLQVRQQYEDNPYPRWNRVAPVHPATGIAGYLRGEFPLAPIHEAAAPGSPNILVAGCGTGQQPIEVAQRFPRARVLAIDLSLASLAYARRKAAEAGVGNIEFAQADIVAFDSPGRSFDVIEASGVLHHLAHPIQGWAQLLRMLKPNGFMRLGLYSERGRADIVAAREFAAAGGYAATASGIRRCRQNLLKARDRWRTVVASPDFYSVSACRDLLFHVQEHRMTLPQIAAFLAEHRLSLLGFELAAPLIARYRARFPDDEAMTDLACWHQFETEEPDTFGGMYQFWVQKAA